MLSGSEQLVTYHESYAYDGEGNVVTLTDSNGNVTQTLYTTTGLLRRITDATGNVTEYLYDANLQQVQMTLGAQLAPALRRVLRFGRDEENQLVSTTDAMGGVDPQRLRRAGQYRLGHRRQRQHEPTTTTTATTGC